MTLDKPTETELSLIRQIKKAVKTIPFMYRGLVQFILLSDKNTLSIARNYSPSKTEYPENRPTTSEEWRKSLHLQENNSLYYLGDRNKIECYSK